jgi:hypothetical protein
MPNTYVQVYDSIVNTGGASYNFKTDTLNPVTGYMVAITGYESRYPKPANIEVFKKHCLYYLASLKLPIHNSPDKYLGFWIDGEEMVIDIATNIHSRENAIEWGHINLQKAIWDCVNQCEIKIGDSVINSVC